MSNRYYLENVLSTVSRLSVTVEINNYDTHNYDNGTVCGRTYVIPNCIVECPGGKPKKKTTVDIRI